MVGIMNYLVTGGAGFIGSNLVDYLLANGHAVHVIDNLSSGFRKNISNHISNDLFRLTICSVEDYTFNNEWDSYDGIFHLAAQASVPLSIDNFAASSISNLTASIKILDFCRKHDAPIVYASSSAVYGNSPTGDENGNVELLSPYAADKMVLEIYAKQCWTNYGLSSVGFRFFNVYGPKQDPRNPYSGVISIFVDKILNDEVISINGGSQTRDFIYITDIVYYLNKAMINLIASKAAPIVLNLGTGKSISINSLVEVLADAVGKKPKIEYLDYVNGDAMRSNCALNELSKEFGNIESVSLLTGLKTYISWLLENEEL